SALQHGERADLDVVGQLRFRGDDGGRVYARGWRDRHGGILFRGQADGAIYTATSRGSARAVSPRDNPGYLFPPGEALTPIALAEKIGPQKPAPSRNLSNPRSPP